MEDLPQGFIIEKLSYLGAYLVSIIEFMSDCQQIKKSVLFIINKYILNLFWEN